MEDQGLKAGVDVDGSQPALDNDRLTDLDVVRADDVKGGRRLTDITDGTSNTIMVGEHVR